MNPMKRGWRQPPPKSERKPGGKGTRNGIAAVLIVKNEEKVLERCLRSLDMVDQIVVVDTGSTDRTVEIAKNFTSDVEIMPKMEPFHFGEARNYADRYVRQDWCLTVDADEVVKEGVVNLIRKAFWTHSRATGFKVTFMLFDEKGENPSSILKQKVYRHGRYEWRFRVHEQLHCKHPPELLVDLPDVVIDHLPLAEKAERKQQNLDLLKISVNESPEYVRNSRQLGVELFQREQYQDCVKYLKLYLDGANSERMERSETLIYLGRAYSNLGRYDMAEQYFVEAEELAPERREIYYYKAVALVKVMCLDDALEAARKGLAIPAAAKPVFHLNLAGAWDGTAFQELISFCEGELFRVKAEFERRQSGS